jgi:hypothetical protein
MNLLQETIDDLKFAGKTTDDILWIGTRDVYFSWEDFKKVADTEYDGGFGSQKVAQDLMIVGNGWYMDRHEYDGSESWSFHEPIQKPKVYLKPKALTVNQAENLGFDVSCGWEDLKGINGIKKD